MQYQYPTISPVFVSQGLPHPIIVDSYSHVCVARLKRRKTSLEAHHVISYNIIFIIIILYVNVLYYIWWNYIILN